MIAVSDFDNYAATAGRPRRSAVTIGNFDGCHIGHQSLTRQTVAAAARLGAAAVAVTFWPRPESFFRPAGAGKEPALLFTEAQKTRALGELGLAYQVIQRFDEAFSRIQAEAFYAQRLLGLLGADALVVGDDFRFGHKRAAGTTELRTWSYRDGVALTVGVGEQVGGARVSSTRVRETLAELGDAAAVAAMLGRPYLLEGSIGRGDQLGRQLGVPTANLADWAQLVPRFGIYAGHVWLGPPGRADAVPPVLHVPDEAYPAVFSLGIRPTLRQDSPPVRIEAHLLAGRFGPDELYGRRAGFYLSHWLRPEATFAGLAPLTAQIAKDIEEARRRLGLR